VGLVMGRKANVSPRYSRQIYEAKLRRPGDRIDGNGHKQEGGKIFSRHYEANNTDHAQRVASRLAKKFGARVVSITKFSPEDIIGDWKTWNLGSIISKPATGRRGINERTTLDEIVFNKRK